jgi:DNA polymerase/3'-5' exonuclease PolX
MPSNAEAAEIFRNIADLLDVLGERFKPDAYRRAARSIESLTEDLASVASRDELGTIPGVGEAIAEKIQEYLRTGRISYYDRLQKEIPPGVVEIMRLPGLGPKTARRFWVELGLEGPKELADAIAAGRLDSVKGFGPRKISLIRDAIAQATAAPAAGARMPIEAAYPVGARIAAALRARSASDQVVIAGSFRRRRETVGDLDILVTSEEPEAVFDTFSRLPEVREVRMRGPTKETCILTNGLQVDLRVVEPAAFGAALVYFTGSKDHNVHLRTLARVRGLKVNEYGVFRGEERVGGRTEEEVYATLSLAWIPPELRENRGEIEAAARGPLPPLVADDAIVGDLHVHLPDGAGPELVDRLISEARERNFESVGVVVAGADRTGKPWSVEPGVWAHIHRLDVGRPRVVRAIELGPDSGPREFRDSGAEYAIARAESKARPASESRDPPLPVRLIAHFPEEDETRRGWIDRARTIGAAVEVGPGPERLDSGWTRAARERSVPLHLATGLGGAKDDPTLAIALGFARRAGTLPQEVVNAQPSIAEEPRRASGRRRK